MSRSDNTPWQGYHGPERWRGWYWTESPDGVRCFAAKVHWQDWGFHRGAGRELRRMWWKKDRARVREALVPHKFDRDFGDDPPPTRTRSTVKYDYW